MGRNYENASVVGCLADAHFCKICERCRMCPDDIVPVPALTVQTTVDNFSRGLQKYLNELGLPSQGVLVEVEHRGRVIDNLPAIVGSLSGEQREAALYLSKMVAACGAGLFNAALNFLWDELISKLRTKVLQFDLEYFFDTAIKDPDERKKYSTEEDLHELDDWTLIKASHDCGVISEVGYRHLDYIRTMRNWASAAHPNQAQITGFQLL
jgi:hypothetical protein